MPLQRRVPKGGFKNINRVEYKAINLSTVETLATKLDTELIDFQTLLTAGLINKNSLVKILGKGELTRKLEVHAHAFKKSAQAAIEAIKGTAVKL
jgi:large subunit ribosomal protein L15